MNLKILLMLLIYYAILSLTFALGGTVFTEANEFNISDPLNDSDLSEDEIDTGGLFGTGISFGRFFVFVAFGIGLPSDTPGWFITIFAIWQTIMTIYAVGFIIASIWNG